MTTAAEQRQERRAWMGVLGASLLGGGGVAMVVPQVAPEVVRPDAWTATEARTASENQRREWAVLLMEESERLRREWRLDLREAEQVASTQRPPAPTRTRIIALEAGVLSLHRLHGETWHPGAAHFANSKIGLGE